MKKLTLTTVVSSPPQCLLKIWPLFLRTRSRFNWEVVYLTHASGDGRSVDVIRTWKPFQLPLKFLEFEYNQNDEENFEISFDREEAGNRITESCQNSDIILTHNHLGDHGSIHNVFVNSIIEEIDKPKIYFGYSDDNDNNLIITSKQYGNFRIPTQNLQWTRQWIDTKGDLYTGKYFCDDRSKELLAKNANISFTR